MSHVGEIYGLNICTQGTYVEHPASWLEFGYVLRVPRSHGPPTFQVPRTTHMTLIQAWSKRLYAEFLELSWQGLDQDYSSSSSHSEHWICVLGRTAGTCCMARGVLICLWHFALPLRQHRPLQRRVSSALPTACWYVCMLTPRGS